MTADRELEISVLIGDGTDFERRVQEAFDAARDQDQITWITDVGKRICAIVPEMTGVQGDLARQMTQALKTTGMGDALIELAGEFSKRKDTT